MPPANVSQCFFYDYIAYIARKIFVWFDDKSMCTNINTTAYVVEYNVLTYNVYTKIYEQIERNKNITVQRNLELCNVNPSLFN